MIQVGVVLSGCGVLDGAEIHESVLTLLALDREGARAICMAPDVQQMHVVDHLTGEPTQESRNVLVESARIARGEIVDLAGVDVSQLDALIFPGGFGAAKNLCDFATAGPNARVHPQVARVVQEALAARKPIAALCIAPALIAAIARDGELGVELTIGRDAATAGQLGAMGATHRDCSVEEVHVDEQHRIVSTPAYMLAGGIAEAARGIERAVAELLRLAR